MTDEYNERAREIAKESASYFRYVSAKEIEEAMIILLRSAYADGVIDERGKRNE